MRYGNSLLTVQVFVNISNDGWYGDSGAYAQHLKQARMRAVENARWLLRDTNTGVTSAIDPYGRVVASIPPQDSRCAGRSVRVVKCGYDLHAVWGLVRISVCDNFADRTDRTVLITIKTGKGKKVKMAEEFEQEYAALNGKVQELGVSLTRTSSVRS